MEKEWFLGVKIDEEYVVEIVVCCVYNECVWMEF